MKDIKPIRTEADYDAAVEEIERLMEAGAEEGTPDADRLEVLAVLVDAYEEENEPIDPPEPVEAIHFALDQQQVTKKQLEVALGGRNRMSEVLSRRRGLSLSMIRELARLGLPLSSLVGEVRLASAPGRRGVVSYVKKPKAQKSTKALVRSRVIAEKSPAYRAGRAKDVRPRLKTKPSDKN